MLRTVEMPRLRRQFKLDERVLEGLKVVANRYNSSVNNWVETKLIGLLKDEGILSQDFKPIEEKRGGLRTKSKDENND